MFNKKDFPKSSRTQHFNNIKWSKVYLRSGYRIKLLVKTFKLSFCIFGSTLCCLGVFLILLVWCWCILLLLLLTSSLDWSFYHFVFLYTIVTILMLGLFLTFVWYCAMSAHVDKQWSLLLWLLLECTIKLNILNDNLMSLNFRNQMWVLF